MSALLQPINLLGIVVASILVMILGGVWFALLFERTYATFLGRAGQPKSKMAPLYFIGPSLCMLVTTITIAILMKGQRVESLGDAVRLGALIGFGLLAATAINMGINPNIPRPIAYGLLSAGYFFVSSVLISAVLYLVS